MQVNFQSQPLQDKIIFMERAVQLAKWGMQNDKGHPFGSVIVKEGKIVGQAYNTVTSTNDCTAHGQVNAIRDACKKLNTYKLTDCELYTNCEPCPMCVGAIYWSGITKFYYANTKKDLQNTVRVTQELSNQNSQRPIQSEHIPLRSALQVFDQWRSNLIKIEKGNHWEPKQRQALM